MPLAELPRFLDEIPGRGGTDLSPALVALDEDPEVEGIYICSDGYFPCDQPQKPVEWLLTVSPNSMTRPKFGSITLVSGAA